MQTGLDPGKIVGSVVRMMARGGKRKPNNHRGKEFPSRSAPESRKKTRERVDLGAWGGDWVGGKGRVKGWRAQKKKKGLGGTHHLGSIKEKQSTV